MVSPGRVHSPSARTSTRTLTAVQHVLFWLLWTIAVVRAWSGSELPSTWLVGIAAALGGCHALGSVVARRGHRGLAWGWCAALVLTWALAAQASDGFRWLMFPLILLVLHVLPRPAALATVLAMTCWTIGVGLPSASERPLPQILGPVLGALTAVGVWSANAAIVAESRQRALLVAELTQARDEAESLAADLAVAQREAGAQAERARLARDIHDTLAQGFSSIVLLARAAGSASTDPAQLPSLIAQIEHTAADNLDEARRVVRDLAPSGLHETPLPAALGRLLAQLQTQTGIETDLHVEGPVDHLPMALEVALLRLAQGALANVRLHSHARRCVLTLERDAMSIGLDIVDDGVGFDVAAAPTSAGGFGLRAMRERVAELGGRIDVESDPGDGCAVAIRIPLEVAWTSA